ncbi:MAG: ABC transporter permease [Muribaculum sp.]|nr:ABC transporter permease [Muribaculum sp.]
MMRFFRHVAELLKQNPIQSAIVIIGTAVTLAFVMVVVMNYHLRVADALPEPNRGRTVYVSPGVVHNVNGTNYNHGIGRLTYERLLEGLPGVDLATWYGQFSQQPCALTVHDRNHLLYLREVGDGWFDFMDYDFIAGRPFSVEENREKAREVVISRSAAKRLAGGEPEDLVGKEITVNYAPMTVTGVYEDVSPIFQTAFADVLLPFDFIGDDRLMEGLMGFRYPLLMLSDGASMEDVVSEIDRREAMLNNEGRQFEYHSEKFYDQLGYSLFRDSMINPVLVYGLLIMVLLVVPALGVAGLINAQMQSRLGEIAIRKAYGATNGNVIAGLFLETLVSTLIGAVVGYGLACLAIWLGREWMFNDIPLSEVTFTYRMLVNPLLILYTVLACLLFTSLASIVPAWTSTRHNIASTLKGGEK